jgi:ABC-type branched-subunit amino acid transport system ATPase component
MLYHYAVGTYFESFNSLTLVVLVVIITIGEPWYAVIGAIGYSVIPAYIHGQNTSTVLNLLFGLGAATAAWGTKGGTTPAFLRNFLDRIGGRTAKKEAAARATAARAAAASAAPGHPGLEKRPEEAAAGAQEGLLVDELSVQFGGVRAVNGVTLKAPGGVITGLIGPNGAGKTTIFNACSGLNRPSAGRILFHGVNVGHEGPAHRARRGLGRTFQRTELFNSLTVRQNVEMGREAAIAGSNPLAQLVGSRQSSRLISSVADEALAITGTTRLADTQAGLLPVGQRRLVELARALAGPFDLLLLDEPSSGLDGRETEEFGRVLQSVVRDGGRGILLVEHDMTLVRAVCDYVYVLDFGLLIFEGTPQEMQDSDEVRAAYLGGLAVTIGASDETGSDDGRDSLLPSE